MPRMVCVSLYPHAKTPSAAVQALQVSLRTESDGALRLHFELDADTGRVVFPAVEAPGFSDGLWRHTCFELFAAGAAEAYREFNFAPSSRFAIYDFAQFRTGMRAVVVREPPAIEVSRGGLSVEVCIPAELLSPDGSPELKVGIAAVIEERSGALSYWAVNHPADKPDFHDRRGFVVGWPPGIHQ